MNNDKSAIQVIAGAARCPEYSPSMVKALMKKLETNEKAFALLMNVTPSRCASGQRVRPVPAAWPGG